MTSRRAYLGVAGTTLGATAGCLSSVFDGRTRTEHVQYKHIFVDVDTSEQHLAERGLLRLRSRQPGEIAGYVAEDHADLVDDDGSVSVSEERHESFTEAYAGVRYAVSFCGGDLDSGGETGCRGTNVSREDFGRVQFGDEVTAEFDANGDDATTRITDVEAGSTGGWDVDVETVEFPDEAE